MLNENIMGLDIGTGFVKVATKTRRIRFPSIIATGKHLDLESSGVSTHVGYDAIPFDGVKSMILKTPMYRGIPVVMDDYIKLIRHSINYVIPDPKGLLSRNSNKYHSMIIVAGIPYAAKEHAEKIKNAVAESISPKSFNLIFQAQGTLLHEGLNNGIICHIGHGTTELMVITNNKIAYGKTIKHGVGDITSVICDSKTSYVDKQLYTKNTPELIECRGLLACSISDVLEKTVIDYPGIPVICAGGGALVPKLVNEIKNDTITNIRIAKEPIFGNALGMLIKAEKYVSD